MLHFNMSIKHIDYVYSDWQWVVHKVIIRIVQVRMIFYFEIEKLRGENRTISLRERKNERACDLNISIFRIKLCALHLIYIYVSTIFEHHTYTHSARCLTFVIIIIVVVSLRSAATIDAIPI